MKSKPVKTFSIPSFQTTREEAEFIHRIAMRAAVLYQDAKIKMETLEIDMDVTAVHANGCRLNLEKLFAFPDFDFMHDITGMNRHLDRNTGKLRDCFVPRSAQ
jgi:hypothetical protein